MSKLEFLEQTYRDVKMDALNNKDATGAMAAMYACLVALAAAQQEEIERLKADKKSEE